MTTHYILADDFDRWNPGEPIEDVSSDVDYLYIWYVTSDGSVLYTYDAWLAKQITAGNIIRIETDENGKIL